MTNGLKSFAEDAISNPTLLKEFGGAILIISVISVIVRFAIQDMYIIVGLFLLGFISYALGLAGEVRKNEA